MSNTVTDRDMRDHVTYSLGPDAGDFDIDAIVRDFIQAHGTVNLNEVPSADYWGTIRKHAKN